MDTKKSESSVRTSRLFLIVECRCWLTQLVIAISSACPVTGISVAAKPKGKAVSVTTAIAMADVDGRYVDLRCQHLLSFKIGCKGSHSHAIMQEQSSNAPQNYSQSTQSICVAKKNFACIGI